MSLHLCQATGYGQQAVKQSPGNLPATEVLQALCPQQEPLTVTHVEVNWLRAQPI